MIGTKEQARAAIAASYGAEFAASLRFVKRAGATLLVRPSYETQIGLPTLVWRKPAAGDTYVHVGRLLPGLTIDWSWVP